MMKIGMMLATLVTVAAAGVSSAQNDGAVVEIEVDATLYKKHQVCIADVRDAAGRITEIRLVGSAGSERDLDQVLMHLYWDGRKTPFVVCSVRELLALLGPDGVTGHLPEMAFGDGFRIFVECVAGGGAKLQGHISYQKTDGPTSSRRFRYDPGLGITVPREAETIRLGEPGLRLGRGERIEVPDCGFESGGLNPWRDISWEPGGGEEAFVVYRSGVEGVRAHSGRFMAGIVRGGNCKGHIRTAGLVGGYRYRLSAWINTWGLDKDGYVDKAKARIGINSTGTFLTKLHPEEGDLWTTDFSHEKFYYPHCWGSRMYAHSHDHWSRISVETRAAGEVACIILDGSQLLGDVRKWTLFDDISLENISIPMGSIEGSVTAVRGKAVGGAVVTTEPWHFAGQTGSDGSFRIEDIPEGVYAVGVEHDGMSAAVSGVRVMSSQTAGVELTLGGRSGGRILRAGQIEAQNQLINADFESGDLVGWERAYLCDAMRVGGATKRVAPVSGNYMFGGEHVYHYAGAREVIYQRIPVAKGTQWTLRGRLFSHSADGRGDGVRCRLVVDPAGGTTFSIVGDYHKGEWKEHSLSFAAESDVVTVGVEMLEKPRAKGGKSEDEGIVGHLLREDVRTDYNGYYCDDLRLMAAAPGSRVARAGQSAQERRALPLVGKRPEFSDGDTAAVMLADGKTHIELVRIPAGEFLMGGDSRSGWAGDDEFPRHRVHLDSFWIGRYEVTNAQYKVFCDATGRRYPADPAFSRIPWMHRDRRYFYGDYFTQMPDYPVVNVTWHDARAFCEWAGLRLATEAEWEMAARGAGDSLKTYPWGEQTNPAWTVRTRDNTSIQNPDGDLYTCRVGKFESHTRPYKVGASIFGVSEMAGNVREWCADWYGPYSEEEQANPKGPAEGRERVLRGGCWRGRDYGVMTRCSYRFHHDPDYFEWGTTGFRVACSVQGSR